jgi:4'-phosphopantetheinyl transferase
MTPDLVTVWTVRADQPPHVTARLSRLLDEDEMRRAASMPDAVRRGQFVVAHGAMREIVGAQVGVPAEAVSWRRGPNGKPHPELAEGSTGLGSTRLCVNLSNCGGTALVALCEGREVGVDVERLPADRIAVRLSARYFPEDEAWHVADGHFTGDAADRFTTLWSRKEACVKAHGGRLSQGMPLRVNLPTPFTVAYPDGTTDGFVRVHDLPAPVGHRAAVALAGSAPFDVCIREWPGGAPATDTTSMIKEVESYV